MNREHEVNMETLNVIQQVLRGALSSIASASRADLVQCATLMQAFAGNPALDRRAQAMLLDLAQGLDVLGRASSGQTSGN